MSKSKRPFDPTFVVGLLIALGCILGGLILEKGEVRDVTQVTAALIVLGGTIGAVVISTPKIALINAIKRAPSVLWGSAVSPADTLEKLITFALIARRSGVKELDKHVDDIQDRFFKKAMMLLIDGFTSDEIRTLLETDMDLTERQADNDAKVFDSAGGYAPTIGIIGAVLGLIQVMKHLDQMQEVGRGIAVAFVATVYGVSAANLLFLPIANKIRSQARANSSTCEMIAEGIIAIQSGNNPRVIRQLLAPFVIGQPAAKVKAEDNSAGPVYAENRKAS